MAGLAGLCKPGCGSRALPGLLAPSFATLVGPRVRTLPNISAGFSTPAVRLTDVMKERSAASA
jgi:hypothetical protein